MKSRATITMVVGMVGTAVAIVAAAGKTPVPPGPPLPKLNYEVVNEFKIGGAGPWNSVTLDAAGKYLYIPRGKHTQVVDTATGKLVADIGPGQAARRVALAPEANRGFITNFQNGTVTVFDLKTNAVLGDIAVGANPGGILYDPASKRILVRCGASNIVPLPPDIDVRTGKPEPAITFDSQIRGLVADGQGMVYASEEDKNTIGVLDTRTMTIAAHWPVGAWQNPADISMDRVHSRLFVTCGSKLAILSASDGHILDQVVMRPTAAWKTSPATTAYYDGHVFGVSGDGTMTIVGQKPNGDFAVDNIVKVEPNSQPIALDANTGKIYLPTGQMNDRKPVPDTFKILVLQKK